MYAELHCKSNFSFLTGASHPQELVAQAQYLGYRAIAITDECSLAGVVKAHQMAEECGIQLIIGSEFLLSNNEKIVALAPTRQAYAELSGFITLVRKRSEKGSYQAHLDDLRFRLRHCIIIWLSHSEMVLPQTEPAKSELSKPEPSKLEPLESQAQYDLASHFAQAFPERLYIGMSHQLFSTEKENFIVWKKLADRFAIPLVACGSVLMHESERKPLQDVLVALKHKRVVKEMGTLLERNAEAYLKPLASLDALYPDELLENTLRIAEACRFSLNELKYQYPEELVPAKQSPISYLKMLVSDGAKLRWPNGPSNRVSALLAKELALIEELHYEYYFLTVYDIVKFARSKGILCQGRGSAANSIVCYCLHITEISPDLINVLFERFISKERDEPPDIDVDFEHSRREEVIQYIYQKYGRERAALAATVITYKTRSAIRDVGKALDFAPSLIEQLAKSLAWWDRKGDLQQRMNEAGMSSDNPLIGLFYDLVQTILGFPRHLSQHVGGFVITQDKISDIVPIENASMADRTVIQWDKEDLEAMGLMKVDVLALGMLTAIRKAISYVRDYEPELKSIADIPKEDNATYAMLSRADSLGVFQVESRAQMSMLPRLKPKKFYDLVIQIAIVRPGPIQGGMVHPYLKRRNGIEKISYYNDELKDVLESTLGVPIFQEQAIRLAMVAAGFSGGEADKLRRAMASWGKNGNLLTFEEKFIQGMLAKGYPEEFALRMFEQIKGFGGYGFPESHSASFAILCYFSSWLKCHHPAAFYCALLNSQPMGFYSPSQLIQDARRHNINIQPIDINKSHYECCLEAIDLNDKAQTKSNMAVRLGFVHVKALNRQRAKCIAEYRKNGAFSSVEDFKRRTSFTQIEMQVLAEAEAFHMLLGHRYHAHWAVAGVQESKPLFDAIDQAQPSDALKTQAPSLEKDIVADVKATNISLRPHIMSLLRRERLFSECKKQNELLNIRSGGFVKVAGLVTGRQRPGTAKGTVFLTLEDETGNINVIVWPKTQSLFRQVLLTGKLLLIKGRVETEGAVVHVVAGQIIDCSERISSLDASSRDFH